MQVPMGPKVQDNTSGKRSQNRTYTDLLKDEHDMEVCKYYFFDGNGTYRMAGDVLCNIQSLDGSSSTIRASPLPPSCWIQV